MWGAILGAALGAAKHNQDRKAAQRARQQEAQIAQWSPWTGMQAQRVQDPSLIGNVGYGAFFRRNGGATNGSSKATARRDE